jgi:hypothetical protein
LARATHLSTTIPVIGGNSFFETKLLFRAHKCDDAVPFSLHHSHPTRRREFYSKTLVGILAN